MVTFAAAEEHGKNLNCGFDLECLPDLVCAFQRCHQPCTASRDCPAGQRCIEVRDLDAGVLLGQVCRVPEESRSTMNSRCPDPLICGVDGRCRDEWQTARDCI